MDATTTNSSTFNKISIPIILQSLLTMSLPVIDMSLIIPLGENSIAAVTIVSTIVIGMFALQQGIAQAILIRSVSASQKPNPGSYLYYGINISLFLSILITFAIAQYSNAFYFFLTDNALISTQASLYFKYIAFTIPITAITVSIGFFLRGNGRSLVTLSGFAIEIPINLVLSYWLMYGSSFNMGIEGAAIGSLVARFFRLLWMLGGYYHFMTRHCTTTEWWCMNLSVSEKKNFRKFVASLAATSFGLGIGNVVIVATAAGASAIEFAMYGFLMTYQGMAFTIVTAIASTTAIMISTAQSSDQEQFDRYHQIYKLSNKMAAYYIFIPTLIIFIVGTGYYQLFATHNQQPSNIDNSFFAYNIIVFAVLMAVHVVIKGYTTIYSNGYLKPSNHHLYCLIIEQTVCWVFYIPLALIVIRVLQIPLYWALFGWLIIDGIYLLILRRKTILTLFSLKEVAIP